MVRSPLQQLHACFESQEKHIQDNTLCSSNLQRHLELARGDVSEACQLEDSLDDAIHQFALPTVTMQAATGISSAADESEVRGAIMSFLYSTTVVVVVALLQISFTNLVVRRTGQPVPVSSAV